MGSFKRMKSVDLTIGERRNYLVYLERVGAKNGFVQIRCKCDCGNILVVCKANFLSGATKSCGCYRQKIMAETAKSRRLPPGISTFKLVLYMYKKAAAERGHCFSLSESRFYALTQMPCSYCGCPPATLRTVKSKHGTFLYNGVDRIDNTIGYLESNVVPCCKLCQYAKRHLRVEVFLEWAKRLVAFQEQHPFQYGQSVMVPPVEIQGTAAPGDSPYYG